MNSSTTTHKLIQSATAFYSYTVDNYPECIKVVLCYYFQNIVTRKYVLYSIAQTSYKAYYVMYDLASNIGNFLFLSYDGGLIFVLQLVSLYTPLIVME